MSAWDDIINDHRCDYSGLIVSQCAHCRGLSTPESGTAECDGCGKSTQAGDSRVDGLVFCPACVRIEDGAA